MADLSPINRIRKRIELYKKNNQWDKAAEEYQHLISFFPADAELHMQAGDAYLRAGQGLSAITWYLSAAQMHETDNELDKAVATLKKILKIKPSLMDIKVRLSAIVARQGKTGQAIEQYEEAFTYFSEMNEMEEALSVFKKIVELQPRNLIVHRKLADMYAERKHTAQALVEYRTLLQKVREMGLSSEVMNLLQKIVSLDQRSSQEALELVQMYYKTEHFEMALEELQRFLSQNPTYSEAFSMLGDIFFELGRKREAIAAYERYLSSNRRDSTIRRKTVQLQIDEGDYVAAIEGAWMLIDHFFGRGYLTSATNVMAMFDGHHPEDIAFQELYVKLLGQLDMKDAFESALAKLLELLEKAGRHERIAALSQLRDDPAALKKISQYLTGRSMLDDVGPGEDAIDELAETT